MPHKKTITLEEAQALEKILDKNPKIFLRINNFGNANSVNCKFGVIDTQIFIIIIRMESGDSNGLYLYRQEAPSPPYSVPYSVELNPEKFFELIPLAAKKALLYDLDLLL